jgi:hypothetical protein
MYGKYSLLRTFFVAESVSFASKTSWKLNKSLITWDTGTMEPKFVMSIKKAGVTDPNLDPFSICLLDPEPR